MLIEKNLRNKRKSWYICDRCGEKLNGVNRQLVSINYKKEFDLCRNCVKALKRGIEKGKKNERNDNVG